MKYDDIFGFVTDNDTKSTNSIERLEQKDIINEHSVEEDDDSFESSASSDTDDTEKKDDSEKSDTSESSTEDPQEESSDVDDDFPDDPLDEDGDFDDSDSDDSSDDSDSSGSDDSGSDSGDSSSGGNKMSSSVNPFTDVNQRLYLLDQMNLLYSSIVEAIDKYNISYAETVELQQLKELLEIVEGEQKSFIMQQNPENMIKYELYLKRFEEIIRNLTDNIKETK